MSHTSLLSLTLIALLSSAVMPAVAADSAPEVLRLWDGDAPHAGGTEPIDVPTLHLYRVESKQPTPGIIICPGGGYGNLAMDHEGAQIAAWFNRLGVTAGVCVYRHRGGGGNGGKGYGHPVPLLDAQRALRTMRSSATQWNVDPNRIGIIGFSAGGHLASTVSTHHDPGKADSSDKVEQVSSRPDFAILAYPVIAFDKPFTHRGSQKNLLGENPDPALVASLSNEAMVKADTPPTFLFHTAEDKGVPPENSIVYFLALQKAGVPAELHVFEKGRHGIGLGADVAGANAWPGLCEEWLKVRQIIRP
ncbi:MAG: alpha/beta hydrolase [Planctomycetaceae bacterium]